MYTEVFPARLKKAREYHGYTQDDIAKTLKISTSAYTNYEAGRREPNLELVAVLAKIYEVTADWLLGLSSDSGLNAISQVIQDREREKILKKLEKEAELARRVWC